MSDFLKLLRAVNADRAEAWAQGAPSDPMFWAVELGGEVGEILNVVKKLRREEIGWRGSRATIEDLANEIADGLICLDSLARHYGIDLAEATARKFDSTSAKVGLPHSLVQPLRCEFCGRRQDGISTQCIPPFDVRPHRFTGNHPADRLCASAPLRETTTT